MFERGRSESRWTWHRLAAAGCAILSTTGCGDALVSGDSLKDRTPSFTVTGSIVGPVSNATAPLGVGLLWTDPLGEGKGNWVAGADSMTASIDADGIYRIELFGAPPEGAVRSYAASAKGGGTFAFGWAEIVLYEDHNGDGTFEVGPLAEGSPMIAPDVYRGVGDTNVVIYVAAPIGSEDPFPEFSHLITTVTGYHLGLISCVGNLQTDQVLAYVDDVTPPSSRIQLMDPSSAFPGGRLCLRSQPQL